MDGPEVYSALEKLRARGPCLPDDMSYFAIVYSFVPEETLDEKMI